MSLRLRLTAVTVALVALGLLAAGLATHYALQSFLVGRLDGQISAAEPPVLHALSEGSDNDGGVQGVSNVLPAGSYAGLVAPGGRLLHGLHVSTAATGSFPGYLLRAHPGWSSLHGYRVLTANAARIQAAGPDEPEPVSGTLVIAIPLADVHGTLDRLTLLELVAGAGVLVVVGGLALAMVAVGLRPLRRIEATAAAIAAGDLTRRVEAADPRTEVGRLSRALNAMLAQIERAFREREASEARLRRFVADASHELRTPLTSVRGYAELFRRGAASHPDDLAAAMERIEGEATRMGVLVDDLLLLARLDQGRPLAREPVDLTVIVSDLVRDHRALHAQWPVELHAPAAVTVIGDELRLRQAVGNLLANARAHCPPGTPVAVSVAERRGEVVVEVADAGPGLDPADAARVFERFFRADPSRARASGGSGLGLSIVASIAEWHGGRAEVESAPGDGAAFRIVLPAGGSGAGRAEGAPNVAAGTA